MRHRIVPIAEEHVEGFRAAVDSVAREERYLAMLEAPPLEVVQEFVRENVRCRHSQFVALDAGQVVGWCDIVPKPRVTLRHSGILGIGVVASHRQRGIGTDLIRAALEAAWASGLTRVELTVRTDNGPAKALYEKFGFVVEGLCRNHTRVRGVYQDSYLMALVYGDDD